MRNKFVLLVMLFASIHTMAQQSKRYVVLDVPKTIITTLPIPLLVKDTINKNRSIHAVNKELGGLKPAYPMAESYESLNGYVYNCADCLEKYHTLSGHCTNYLVEMNDSILEINSKEKFIELFAPVEDKEEALSFAYALCGLPDIRALYDFRFLDEKGTDYEIFRKEIVPTSVNELPDGYEVILFNTYWGYTAYCSEVVIYVSRLGEVKVIKRESMFHDKNFNLIID